MDLKTIQSTFYFRETLMFLPEFTLTSSKFAFNMMTFITSLNLEVTDEIKESLNEVLDELT